MKKIGKAALCTMLMTSVMSFFGATVFADYKDVPIEDCIDTALQIEQNGDNSLILSESEMAAIDRVLEFDFDREENGEKQVESIKLNRTKMIMAPGDVSDPLIAELEPKNGTGGRLTWYTTNASVATVNNNGAVTAVGTGTAGVYCASENDIVAACGINVIPYTPLSERLSFYKTGPIADNYKIGDTFTLCSAYNGYLNDNEAERAVSIDVQGVVECVSVSKSNNSGFTMGTFGSFTYNGSNYSYYCDNVTDLNAYKFVTTGAGTATITLTLKNGCSKSVTVTVLPDPESIIISSEYAMMAPGQTRSLSLTVQPEDASLRGIKWTSDNTGVASVDENGNVTAVSEGTATITASAGNEVKAECRVEVVPKEYVAESIRIFTDSSFFYKGCKSKLYVVATPSTAKLDLEYSASNSKVNISADGVVSPVDTGFVTITVTDKNTNLTSVFDTRVRLKTEASGIVLQSNDMSLKVGETQPLLYTIYPIGMNSEVSITTENTDIIAIDKTNITGLKAGVARINVTADNISDSILVTVRKADSYDISKITLNKTTYNVKVGDVFNIDYDSDITTKMFGMNWQSSNINVASVNRYGTVTARAVGHVTIQVSSGTLKPQTCDVFITEADEIESLDDIDINYGPRSLVLTVGDVKPISSLGYTITPESLAAKVRVESLNPQILEVANDNIIAKGYGRADLEVYIPNFHIYTITVYVYKNETETAIDRKAFAEEVLACMNAYRTEVGIHPLTLNDNISDLAQIRAEECITNYSHTRPDGSKWSTIFKDTEYATTLRAENLLKVSGYANAQELVDCWMSSPSHKYNIMNSNFTSVGVGSILAINTTQTDYVANICTLLFVS